MNEPSTADHCDAAISVTELQALCDEQLPIAGYFGLRIEMIEPGAATVRAPFKPDFTRPGGTVAGPVLMAAADLALYAVTLSLIGPVPLAVTTQLNINFLRKPEPADVLAHGSILKIGKRLAVAEVSLYSVLDGDEVLVAHATGSYSIPPADGSAARPARTPE